MQCFHYYLCTGEKTFVQLTYDLLDRLELFGGSVLAGNNGVKNEFSKIAHTLNKLGVLNNTQLNSLLKEYVI